jgi:hypothetical protein
MYNQYEIIKFNPVAKFFYKGKSHTHPVRRTIVIVDYDKKTLTGYELREGTKVRNIEKAPIKTYRKDKIARVGEVDARRVIRHKAGPNELKSTTLRRETLVDLLRQGV